jgi:hypothetical protein
MKRPSSIKLLLNILLANLRVHRAVFEEVAMKLSIGLFIVLSHDRVTIDEGWIGNQIY